MRRALMLRKQQFLLPVLTLALLSTSGCAHIRHFFRDRSAEYGQATSTPPLVLPAGVETRPIRALYPVPDATAGTQSGSKPYVVPVPPAMAPIKPSPIESLPEVDGRLVVKYGTDGNGIPELRVLGPRERVWDELGKAVTAAGVTIKDRNQSLGLLDVTINQVPYQVRMVRGAEAFVINLQRDENTLAPVGAARTLLSNLQARWP